MASARSSSLAAGASAAATPEAEFDGPWKEALGRYFRDFLRLFFPAAYRGIDWSRGCEFLDGELQKAVRDAKVGRRQVDKLARVCLRGGGETWLLVHVEVQGHAEAGFAERMFIYNYRLFDRYARRVISLAVLADAAPAWRPCSFGYRQWGFRLRLEFPVVKLRDFVVRRGGLERSRNPFALVVLAHLDAQATAGDATARLRAKVGLVRSLFERAYSRRDVLELFRFIDWLLALPAELAARFDGAVRRLAQEKKMAYVSSFERHAEQRGVQRGIERGIERGRYAGVRDAVLEVLSARFDKVPVDVRQALERVRSEARLRRLLRAAATVPSLEAFTLAPARRARA